MIIPRHMCSTLKRLAFSFPAVLVTGARQTGKTTLFRLFENTRDLAHLSFDDPGLQLSVESDPKTFFQIHPPPLVLDEIQQVPKIFPYLKLAIDEDRRPGMFFLTGSQQFHLMKNVSESLAGRIAVLFLPGISLRERLGDKFTPPFVPGKDFLLHRKPPVPRIKITDLWNIIHSGSFPEVVTRTVSSQDFYPSYIRTYIARDVRALTQVENELGFIRFITAAAARTGQLLNYAAMARDTGLSEPTVKKWISILISSGLIYLLPPYFANVEKRLVKTPKLYFLDTGLAAHLTRWSSSEVLMQGAMSGAYFETFVISEIVKSFSNQGMDPPLYFYRDKDGIEIDLLIEDNGILFPLEIKQTADPGKTDARSFSILDRIKNMKIGTKSIVCPCDSLGTVAPGVFTVPVSFL